MSGLSVSAYVGEAARHFVWLCVSHQPTVAAGSSHCQSVHDGHWMDSDLRIFSRDTASFHSIPQGSWWKMEILVGRGKEVPEISMKIRLSSFH